MRDDGYEVSAVVSAEVRGGQMYHEVEYADPGVANELLPVQFLSGASEKVAEFNAKQNYNGCSDALRPLAEPPDYLLSVLKCWPFLTRYIVESLIQMDKLSWEKIDLELAGDLQDGDLIPLQRHVGPRLWPKGLPTTPERCDLAFSAKVTLDKYNRPVWELQWPERITREKSEQLIGMTKRLYEEHGSWNILTVELQEAGVLIGSLERLFCFVCWQQILSEACICILLGEKNGLLVDILKGAEICLANRTWRRPKARVAKVGLEYDRCAA
eukprot:SAG31_NODE_2712_length_5208_cov_1.414563_6_plen_270_part_01